MNRKERDQLIDDLLDGDISEADMIRLEAEFHADPSARRAYYDRLTLATLLENEAEEAAGRSEGKVVDVDFRNSLRIWKGVAVAAALVALALIGFQWWEGKEGVRGDGEFADDRSFEPRANGFAVLSGSDAAVWGGDNPLLRDGDLVPSGVIVLSSGVAQVEFFSGVTVVLEGEAEFSVDSQMKMWLGSGKMRANVPPAAEGFQVATAQGEIIDLGTEFALSVSDEESEIHVIDGEIEWHPEGETKQNLGEGEAIKLKPGSAESISARVEKFIGVSELEARIERNRQQKLQSWRAASETIRSDPRLIAYYPMDQDGTWNRKLKNEAGANPDPELDGAGVVATRTFGRWEGKGALDFSPAGSRVRVSIPGAYPSLTLMCWVRIDSLDRLYNSLFLTDGHELHEPHWQIMEDGRLFFSVKKREWQKGKRDKQICFSPPVWDHTRSGKWMHLATVYDVDAATVVHYVDGRPVSEEKVSGEFLVESVKIGAASIGNWSEPIYRKDPEFAVRNLNGAIDEFALFSTALTAEEITGIYENGKP